MRLFMSHSANDKPLVDALQSLLRDVFAEPVEIASSSASVADGGVGAGDDWLDWIDKQVQRSDMTIAVLTPTSRRRPWLMWEAGAVSGAALAREQKTPVVPLLFGTRAEDVPKPLQTRQIKRGTVDAEVRDLIESVRRQGGLAHRAGLDLAARMRTYLAEVRRIGIPGMHDVFISCPMASMTGPDYTRMRRTVEELLQAIRARGCQAYCAVERVAKQKDFDPESIGAERDIDALRASRSFVMIYPKPVISSCLLEAGFALVESLPSTYFVRDPNDLPYMLRGAIERFGNVRRQVYRDVDDIVGHFNRYPTLVVPDLADRTDEHP